MSTARALQNDLQQATGVNVSAQTIRKRICEGGLRERRPVVGPVLTAQHCGARLAFAREHQNWQVRHWCPVLFTDESRFTPVMDVKKSGEDKENAKLPATSFSMTDGGGSVMVLGGISMEGRTDLYCLENGSLTSIRYRDEILEPIVRPYAGAVGPGFVLMHDNAWPHVARVCRLYLEDEEIDTIGCPSRSPHLNPIEHLWDIMFRTIRCHQTLQELRDALTQIWEYIPQDTIQFSESPVCVPFKKPPFRWPRSPNNSPYPSISTRIRTLYS